MPSRIAPDLGDPVRTAWQVAWVGHAMLHDPLHLFDSNAFYPHPLSLAFSDSLLGYGPAGVLRLGHRRGARPLQPAVPVRLVAVLRRRLPARPRARPRASSAAAAAGAAFAYAPYRVTEAGHLHVISSGGIPLALFLLLRGYRRGSRGLVLAGWLVSAWQVSLGFTLGPAVLLPAGRARALLALSPGGAARPPAAPRRAGWSPSPAVGIARRAALVGDLPGAPLPEDLPRLPDGQAHDQGSQELLRPAPPRCCRRPRRTASGAARPPGHARARALQERGRVLPRRPDPAARAAAGARHRRLGATRADCASGWLAGVVTCSVLAMGLGLTGAGYPYRLLFDYAPGWNGVRVPGRVFTLGDAVLRAARRRGRAVADRRCGAARGARARGGAARRGSRRPLPALAGGVLLIGIVGEGAGHLGHPVVPQPTSAEDRPAGPAPGSAHRRRPRPHLAVLLHRRLLKIPIGNSTFDIPAVDDMRGGMHKFPDKASIEKLRYYGIRTVVLHLDTIKDLPPTHGWVKAEPPDPAAAARQADRRPRRHAPRRRLERDLRDRARAEGAARPRLMGAPTRTQAGSDPARASSSPRARSRAPAPASDDAATRARRDRARRRSRSRAMLQNWS